MVVVVDATQLARNLYLVLQVLELRLKVVVALNMTDVLRRHDRAVDAAALSRELGVPVVPISAARKEGMEALAGEVARTLAAPDDAVSRAVVPAVNGDVAASVARVAPHVPAGWSRGDDDRRAALASWALLSLDEDDELWDVPDALRRAVVEARAGVETDLDLALVSARYAWIDRVMPEVLAEPPSALRRATDAVDRLLIHPVVGFGLFLFVMAVVFQSLFSWSSPAIDAVDGFFGTLGEAVGASLPPGILTDFVTEGLIAGVGAVLVFLPQILLLFLFIAIMEDSGYMARVAFLMDRIMKAIGLTGRAFVPMLSGFACAIPAIMATRTMERAERTHEGRHDRAPQAEVVVLVLAVEPQLELLVPLRHVQLPAQPVQVGEVQPQVDDAVALAVVELVHARARQDVGEPARVGDRHVRVAQRPEDREEQEPDEEDDGGGALQERELGVDVVRLCAHDEAEEAVDHPGADGDDDQQQRAVHEVEAHRGPGRQDRRRVVQLVELPQEVEAVGQPVGHPPAEVDGQEAERSADQHHRRARRQLGRGVEDGPAQPVDERRDRQEGQHGQAEEEVEADGDREPEVVQHRRAMEEHRARERTGQ